MAVKDPMSLHGAQHDSRHAHSVADTAGGHVSAVRPDAAAGHAHTRLSVACGLAGSPCDGHGRPAPHGEGLHGKLRSRHKLRMLHGRAGGHGPARKGHCGTRASKQRARCLSSVPPAPRNTTQFIMHNKMLGVKHTAGGRDHMSDSAELLGVNAFGSMRDQFIRLNVGQDGSSPVQEGHISMGDGPEQAGDATASTSGTLAEKGSTGVGDLDHVKESELKLSGKSRRWWSKKGHRCVNKHCRQMTVGLKQAVKQLLLEHVDMKKRLSTLEQDITRMKGSLETRYQSHQENGAQQEHRIDLSNIPCGSSQNSCARQD